MIIGLDLSSRFFGFCAGVGDAIPVADALGFVPVEQDYGALLIQLEDYLDAVFTRFGVTHCFNEGPIHAPKSAKRERGDTLHTMRLLYPLHSFASWFCQRENVAYQEVSVGDVKNELTGIRSAKKPQLVAVARKCGLILPTGPGAEDAADAFGVWKVGLRRTNRVLSENWDKRIYGARGLL